LWEGDKSITDKLVGMEERWSMPNGYLLRITGPKDAGVVAEHRSRMFVDMGLLSPTESDAMMAATEPWIFALLTTGEYLGWFVERDGEVVAGGGLHLGQSGPLPGYLRVGVTAHIANVFTLPSHRRLGLARLLIEEMLRWSRENGVDKVTLEASADGRRLYESLGFVAASMMSQRLRQDSNT
jgi:GNAT superfamily N-acetyltransferase